MGHAPCGDSGPPRPAGVCLVGLGEGLPQPDTSASVLVGRQVAIALFLGGGAVFRSVMEDGER